MTSDKESHTTQEEASLKVHRSRSVRRAEVTTDGRNLVSHAGTALLSELADRTVVGPAARRRGRGRLGRAAQVGRPDAAVGGWELEQERPNDARSVAIAALRSTTPRQVAAEDPAAPSRLITPVNSMGDQHLACRASLLRPATQGRQVAAGAVADGHDPLGTYVFGPSPSP
jgi:hypothetical protein